MASRGQLTIFIILGIIILFSIGIALYLGGKVKMPTAAPPSEEGLTDYVTTCLQQTAELATYLTASQGGYLNPRGETKYGEPGDGYPDKQHYFLEVWALPYVLDKNKIALRNTNEMEKMMANYILVEMPQCLNFTEWEKKGYVIIQPNINYETIGFDFSKTTVDYSEKTVKAEVIIRDADIVLSLTYPLQLSRGKGSIKVEDYATTIPLRFGTLQKTAKKLLENIARANEYKINEHCSEYASPDKMVNIYFTDNSLAQEYPIKIVDVSIQNKPPLKYQFAIKNQKVSGECVG